MTRTRTARRPATPRVAATRTRQRRDSTTEVRWANSLKTKRMEQGKSQTDVANAIGRKQRLVSAIEKGERSGREYMDAIAEYLNVGDPSTIFPYYDFYSYEEAAELMGVSSTLISRRVDEGTLDVERIGGMRLIPKAALDGAELRKRPAKSVRDRLRDQLRAHPEGLTSRQLLMEFAPFEDEETEKRTFHTVQQLLARFGEFEKAGHDADSGLLLWTVGSE